MKKQEEKPPSYIDIILDSLKPNPERVEQLKLELRKQIAKSRLTLIKGGK